MKHPFTPTYITMAMASEEVQLFKPTTKDLIAGDFIIAITDLFGPEWEGEWRKEKALPEEYGGTEELKKAGEIDCIGTLVGGEGEPETNDEDPQDVGCCDYKATLKDRSIVAWIPRLDQLLEMIGSPEDFLRTATSPEFEANSSETVTGVKVEYFKLKDWHELALAVVMQEKYAKEWKGGMWKAIA